MSGNGDINQLSGPQRKKLREAIISAYPSIHKLEIMLGEELDKNLNQITQAQNLDKVVYDLINNAIAEGWLQKLIRRAIERNPGNPQLQDVREQLFSKIPKTDRDRDSVGDDRNSYNTIQTQPFDFETATLGKNLQINRSRGRAESFKEDLGNGVLLEMVKIPGDHFLMGSPENEPERFDREEPQHIVTIQPFFMGKFPITQVQYQTIMGENPSRFKGIKKPAECVTWDNAVEFCARISQRTGNAYRLPSEAEWEYACRARTTTPFYFGETITTDLANYDGNYTYGSAPKGQYREQTTDVGSFPANAFGLYDMHGNVWEWCQDTLHESYSGAPVDGTPWIVNENDNHYRILRGGSWCRNPRGCRCACRGGNGRDRTDNYVGFRVVIAPPRTS